MQKGAAAGAREMKGLVAQVDELGASMLDQASDELSDEELRQLEKNVRARRSEGLRIYEQLLEHVHRTARPGTTPDQLALSRELADYRQWFASRPRG